ncbi:MAG: hypothetical protein O8C56_12680 [Candidatus Methanoperedens sp.]|nr:hypothetical protein [Candidatus Methanoperedens sp.]
MNSTPPGNVNSTAFSLGVHVNITTDGFGLINNSDCWACHYNRDMHRSNIWQCADCHTGSGRPETPQAPKVRTHYLPSVTNYSCVDCHSKVTANPGTGIPNITSHYAQRPTVPTTNYCAYCHGPNATSPFQALNRTITEFKHDDPNWNGNATCRTCHSNSSVSADPLAKDKSSFHDMSWELGDAYNGTMKADCIICHIAKDPQFVLAPNPSHNTTGMNISTCYLCHGTGPGTKPQKLHSVVGAGGPDCISCHYIGSAFHNIDTTAINLSVHAGMNSQNASNAGVASINGACWGCHDTDGNISNNPSNQGMGDIFNTPKKCDDCHLSSGQYYTQTLAWGGLQVAQHYYGGTTIKAGNSSSNISSCINCHENVSEMLLPNNDTDTGSFPGDGVRLNGGNRSFYHYGKKRPELRIGSNENCPYCHQNSTTAFSNVMQNAGNSMLGNHTSDVVFTFPAHPAGLPSCTRCHGQDILHGANISKPVPNSDFCLKCHSNDRLKKDRHNGKVECIRCHTEKPSDVHNIKYILPDGSYRGINATSCGDCHDFSLQLPAFRLPFLAVNCTTCHQNSGLAKFSEAPIIPTPVKHSANPNSGALWNGSQQAYWDNAAQLSSCIYCHGNATHASKALGKIENIRSGNMPNQSITNTSYWCANCHYNKSNPAGNYSYNGTSYSPVPPEIQNKTGLVPAMASDNTTFFNHSLDVWSDSICVQCHGSSSPSTTAYFVHSIIPARGGPDCISCHNVNAMGAPLDKRINFSAFKEGVHRNLNSFAMNNTSLSDTADKACWACHGNATEPVGGHPLNYKTPKTCNNNNCHSLSQSPYNEPMVYSHFQNASLNGNPNNGTNYNITTSIQCQICHINSVVITDNHPQLALVSHYATKDNLIDSFNCTYCHMVKNNSEVWGNATLIYKNTTSLVELEKERNKLTAYEGESIYLGDGYSMKVVQISTERSEALIQLFKNYGIVDEFSLLVGVPYNYEEYITIDNGTFRTPIIILNMTSIFKGASQSLIQFSGFRTARVHAETNSTSCLACHLYRYSPEKGRYLVIDRDVKDNPNHDIVYYTNVLVDFVSENKSKIYYNNDDYVLSQINTNFGKFLPSPTSQKYLTEGETWNIGENVSLKLNGVSTDSKQALLALMINNSVVQDWAVTSGSEFNYTRALRYKGYEDTNVTVFSANLASVAQANPNFILLKNVVAISPSIRQTTANTTVFGFNSSWLFPNDTFIVGKVPENFHAPNLYTDQRAWADCVKCHDTSRKLNIPNVDAVSSRLGKHYRLNINASVKTLLSDSIDKACWACHTLDGQEPQAHIPTYVTPRYCKSCHVYQENPNFGAINISDEPHASEQNCPTCHIQNSHTLVRFDVSPVINKISLSKTKVSRNETVKLVAEAIAGYKFKIRAAEYFLDKIGTSGNGRPLKPVDGKFDSQMKNVTSDINISEIAPGVHTLYIHAMERNNRWGEFSSVNFTISVDKLDASEKSVNLGLSEKSADVGLVVLIFGFAAAYLVVSRRARR